MKYYQDIVFKTITKFIRFEDNTNKVGDSDFDIDINDYLSEPQIFPIPMHMSAKLNLPVALFRASDKDFDDIIKILEKHKIKYTINKMEV